MILFVKYAEWMGFTLVIFHTGITAANTISSAKRLANSPTENPIPTYTFGIHVSKINSLTELLRSRQFSRQNDNGAVPFCWGLIGALI